MKIFGYNFSSIKSKLLFITISIILLFGIAHLLILDLIIKDKLEERFINRGIRLGYHLAKEIEEPLLYENLFSMQQSISEWVDTSPEHSYAMILSPDRTPIVTTFYNKIPVGIIEANFPNRAINQVKVIKNKDIEYYDIAVPIMNGSGGFLRLGLNKESVSSPINRILNILLFMVAVFVFIGVISAYYLSRMITLPIYKIMKASQEVDLNGKNVKLNIHTGDELETLALTYESMIARLQENHTKLSEAIRQVYENEKLASIGYLASGIAHEIRNPLMGITNGLKRIEKNPQSVDQIEKYIPIMLKGSHHIETILNGILQYAKKDTGILSILNVHDAFEDAISIISHRIIEKNIILERPDELNIFVNGNHQNITQILINLMINAIEAMPHGGILSIRVRTESNYLWFDISDTGKGISDEIVDKIWEPFYTSKEATKGTGLGLAVTKSLVEANGGQVFCSTILNHGTTFSFSLALN